jgi:hypothetical protein
VVRWCLHHHGGLFLHLIQGKEGGTQVLAGLAPSNQTVGSNMRTPGATKGGSWKRKHKAKAKRRLKTLEAYNSGTRAARANLRPDLDFPLKTAYEEGPDSKRNQT